MPSFEKEEPKVEKKEWKAKPDPDNKEAAAPWKKGGAGGCGEEEKEEEEDDDTIRSKFSTAPFDARFPNMNQAKHCYVMFLDYHRCVKAKGDCFPGCEYFKKVYTSLCPNEWVKKWNGQIEAGTFAGKI